ncbi:type II secretion system F family protein [Armatimonas sp.]|uniref:type II secretion system F family protein n=1 Tax=Armatimonas sp. TaxID=1872638 RepID=UPI00286AFAF3|nr:type II secretion system F family protein [Armatimonas sp.]
MTELALREWCRRLVASLRSREGEPLSLVGHLKRATGEVEDQELREALERAVAMVEDGYMMSVAFAQNPAVFSEHFVTTVRYGEIYAEVDVTLERYANRPEDRAIKCAYR